MSEKISVVTGLEAEGIVQIVRERYARIARGEEQGCCGPQTACGASAETEVARGIGYSEQDLAQAPEGANLGLGCGAPLQFLALRPGEAVLDLGSGAGLDAFLAARQVGPSGHVIGVDMTPSMLERARASAAKLGLAHVEFREGRLEALPVEAASIDAVTSNCVINLVPDKARVFAEIARVLKPGGRLVVSDIVLEGRLPEAIEKDIYAYVGCVAGAMQRPAYLSLLAAAGLGGVEVLKDVDYLGSVADAAPEEADALLARTGVRREELLGKVRSITYRARKA